MKIPELRSKSLLPHPPTHVPPVPWATPRLAVGHHRRPRRRPRRDRRARGAGRDGRAQGPGGARGDGRAGVQRIRGVPRQASGRLKTGQFSHELRHFAMM